MPDRTSRLDALCGNRFVSLERAHDFRYVRRTATSLCDFVSLHLFVLTKFDSGDSLIFGRSAVDFF